MVVQETLNGGVVQTRHPTLLRPGEVQQADEMFYRPGDPSIHRAPGRTAYGSVRSTDISCTTNGTTALTSSSAFGTDIASVTTIDGSVSVTSSAAFGSVSEGQTIVGTGIPAGTIVRRKVSTSTLELSKACTASGTVTVTVSDLHPGTFISGTGITAGTYIASITSASALTMSAAASDSTSNTRTFSEKVSGLAACAFDANVTDLLVAKAADKLYTSPLTALTGTFTSLVSNLSQDPAATLELIQYRNSYIVLTGFDTPRLLYFKDSGSGQVPKSRPLGMQPVTSFGDPAVVAGSWSSLPALQTGYYWFLVTEVYNPDEPDEVEGTFDGEPKYVRITDYTTQGVLITRSPTGATTDFVNDGLYGRPTATHWRVYMSPKNPDGPSPVPDLSEFRRVATVEISKATVTLSTDNPHQFGWAGVFATYGGYANLFPFGSSGALSTVAKQTVATCVLTADSNVITSSAGFGTVTPGMLVVSTGNFLPYRTVVTKVTSSSSIVVSNAATGSATETLGFGTKPSADGTRALAPPNSGSYRAGLFQNFGLHTGIGGFSSATITGIKVEIFGYMGNIFSADDRGFWISLNKGGSGGSFSSERWVRFENGKPHFISVGDQFDTWGLSWSPSDFADGAASFGVTLRKHGSAVNQNHFIDGIRVTVYGGGTGINLDGEAFRTIILTDQLGNSVGIGSAGGPPAASTGDFVGGQILMNDITRPGDLVGSLPAGDDSLVGSKNFEAFPSGYRLPLNDDIKVIRRYGRGAIIGCTNSVKRLNYFPTEADADFSRGKCYEDIATDHGMVGPRSAVLVEIPGRGTAMVYLSHTGLRATDGVTTWVINQDLDWPNLIDPSYIHLSELRVYPKAYAIALYYVPLNGTERTKVMYFAYHPVHMKDGFQLPAVGPVTCKSGSASSFLVSGASTLFSGHGRDGKVYVEDSGTTDEDNAVPAATLKTRRYYAAGVGQEGRVERLFIMVDAAGNATTGAFSFSPYRQNQGEALTLEETFTDQDTVTGGLVELWPDKTVETFEVVFAKSAAQTAAFRVHYIFFRDSRSNQQDVVG